MIQHAHLARNTNGHYSSVDGRNTRHAVYGKSQKMRNVVEKGFDWNKSVSGRRKDRFRGRDKVEWAFTLTEAGYNLLSLSKRLGVLA